MERTTETRTAKVHTVYVVHCKAKDSDNFKIVLDQACVDHWLELLEGMKKSGLLDEDVTLDNAIISAAKDKTMSTDKILNWKKDKMYCCAIRTPFDTSAEINMIQEWGGRTCPSLFTKENLSHSGNLFSFCNKSRIVEAINERKLVAVDGLGVISKDDLDKIEELSN